MKSISETANIHKLSMKILLKLQMRSVFRKQLLYAKFQKIYRKSEILHTVWNAVTGFHESAVTAAARNGTAEILTVTDLNIN